MSAASPATGAETKAREPKGSADEAIHIELDDGRSRHLGWMLALALIGALLLWKVGTVGQGVGVFLLALAALRAYWLTITLVRGAGVIRVDGDALELPPGLYKAADKLALADVRHAFFLRRAVPWTRSGPMLIVETNERIYSYPRDWFLSDSDQRRVSMAINKRLGRL